MNEVDYLDAEFDLGKLFKFLWKKVWILIIGVIAGILVGYAYYHFTATATYESSAVFYAFDKNYTEENSNIVTNLAATSASILNQTPTLQAVINNQNLPYSPEELKEMIKTDVTTGTEVFTVTVTASDSSEAKKTIDGITAVLPQKISEIINTASIQIVDTGRLNLTPNKPSPLKYLLVGLLFGFFVATASLCLKYILGKKVHDDDFVNRLPVRKPVLINLPILNNKKNAAKAESHILFPNLRKSVVEKYDLLRKNMLFALDTQQSCKKFGITSAMQKEGKSVTAFNLAHSFAEAGKKVLLMEGNLRTPVLANRLNIQSTIGLAEVIEGRNKIEEVLQVSRIHEKLQIMTAGNATQNPTVLLESKNMADLMMALSKDFDCIIVDLPSINDGTDALTLASYIDGLVMVVREEYSEIPALKEAVQKLNFAKANLLGFVYTAKHAGRPAAGTNN